MTSNSQNQTSQHNHGMSNAAVLAIGVVLGLAGAGAFIFMANKADTGSQPATQAVVADTPTTATPTPAAPATDTKPAATPADLSKPNEPAKPLTAEEVQQVRQIKAMLDKAIFNESQKVAAAVKEANAITAGKQVMSLDQAKLQELSSKVKVILDTENNFITALGNVDDALVKLVNQTKMSPENKLRVARGYMYGLAPETAIPFRKANLARWTAFQKFVDFLANHFDKWKYDAEKNNTNLLDESLGDQLKQIVTDVNNTTAAVKQAEARHVQLVKARMAQAQQAAAAAQGQTAEAAAASSADAVTTPHPDGNVTPAPVTTPATTTTETPAK